MARELDEVMAQMYRRGVQALRMIGDDIAGEAARRAPIEEGTLRGSAEVELRESAPVRPRVHSTAEVIVSFSTPYAARQHEETAWAHPRGGQSKYLESVLLERSARYEGILAAAIGKGF